jgi:hypothetical protein
MQTTFALAALLAVGIPATGTPTFSYVSRSSQVQVSGDLPAAPPPDNSYYASWSTSNFSPFDRLIEDGISWGGLSARSEARQTSSLAANAVSATGWTYMEVLSDSGIGSGSASARSWFDVVFDALQATPIELTGWVHTPPGCGPPAGIACEVALFQRVGTSWVELYGTMYESPVDYAATLAAGRYRLNAEAYIAGDTDYAEWFPICGSTYFDITMQIVPEPTALALFLLACLRSRRRLGPLTRPTGSDPAAGTESPRKCASR